MYRFLIFASLLTLTIFTKYGFAVFKLRIYVTFKDSYNVEKYVLLNLCRSEHSLLAQFRWGILPLRIEMGRYIGGKPEERLCRICQVAQTDDETHFLVYCAHYTELRNDHLSSLPKKLIYVAHRSCKNETFNEYLS